MHKGYPLELKQKIIAAFRKVKHPGKKLRGAFVAFREEAEPFRKNQWDEITRGDMAVLAVGVGWMSPEVLHYFIPSYLIHIIFHPDDYLIAEYLIEALATYDEQRFTKLCSLSSRQQKDVIIEVLLLIPTLFPDYFKTAYPTDAHLVAIVKARKANFAKALAYWQGCSEEK
jgi:hypothetical protein